MSRDGANDRDAGKSIPSSIRNSGPLVSHMIMTHGKDAIRHIYFLFPRERTVYLCAVLVSFGYQHAHVILATERLSP